MTKTPYFPFYTSDWLAGTSTLRAVEKGVYITLIALMYDSGKPVPENHVRLARVCGCTTRSFRATLDILISEGKIHRENDGLWNFRVKKTVKTRQNVCDRNSKAATVRWEKHKQKQQTDDAHASPMQCVADACAMPSEPEPEPEKKEGKVNGCAADPAPVSEKLPVRKAFDNFNLVAQDLGLPIAMKLTTERYRKLHLRLQEGSLEEWNRALVALGEQPFLTGENNRGWRASLDFLLQPSSYMKILEGQYAQEGDRDGGL